MKSVSDDSITPLTDKLSTDRLQIAQAGYKKTQTRYKLLARLIMIYKVGPKINEEN